MRKIFILSIAFYSLISATTLRDVLFLQNGEEVRCNIVKITNKNIVVESADSVSRFPIDDVVRITMTRSRAGDEWRKVSDIDDTFLLNALSRTSFSKDFPGATYIVLSQSVRFVFNADSSGKRTERMIVLLLTERGKGIFATNNFYFVSPWQHGDIDFCRTISPDSAVFHLDDAALEFAEPGQYFPQYNYEHRIKFAPPQVSIGAVIDFQYHIDYDIVDYLHPVAERIVFCADEPVLHKELIVEYPASLGDKFCRYYSYEPPQRDLQNGTIRLIWRRDNIVPYIREPQMAPLPMFLPTVWVAFAVDEAKLLQALSDSLKAAMQGSEKIDKFVDSLTAASNTKREKMFDIYEYLNLSFRKAWISPSESRWFPRKASEIFDDGVANSLDLSALMLYMLNRAGIDGKLIYASSEIDRPAISTVTSLGFFSFPIVLASIDGEEFACAPQNKYVPPGVVPGEISGQQSLWIGQQNAQIAYVPQNPIEYSSRTDTLWLSISATGDAEVQIKRVFGARTGASWRYYREMRTEEVDKKFQTMAGNFHPGAALEKYSLTGINGLDSVVIVELELHAPQLAQVAGKKLLAFQLPELRYSTASVGMPERKTPIWNGEPTVREKVWMIRLPERYEPQYIPEEVLIRQDSLRYRLTAKYDATKRTIIANEQSIITDKFIPPLEYPQFRQAAFTKAKAAKRWFILER